MRSTFYGLDIANKGLFIAQRQIDMTGHNISNANTVGFTRQRMITTAVDPYGANAKWIPISKGVTGGGVLSLTVDQIRDRFLDKQYRNENTATNYWDTRYGALYYVEDVFNNLDVGSISDLIGNFFNAIQEVSKNSTDSAVRTQAIERAKALIETMHGNYDQLKS
ncbi:MAG: flagellar basal body protein, partial [Oscillospiraceae bacterium]|nr:flagellar basal body protein [Oscillospiraceae bacterium]